MLWGRRGEGALPPTFTSTALDMRYSKIIPTYWILAVCMTFFYLLFPLPSYNKSPRKLLFLGLYNKNVRAVTSPRPCTSSAEQNPSVSQVSLLDLDPVPDQLSLSLSKHTDHPFHAQQCSRTTSVSFLAPGHRSPCLRCFFQVGIESSANYSTVSWPNTGQLCA